MRATEHAGRYGIANVAVARKLDCPSLKCRLSGTAGSPAERARSTPQPADLVELNCGLPMAPPVCVLVPTDRSGRALRIELPRAAHSDIAEVARSLGHAALIAPTARLRGRIASEPANFLCRIYGRAPNAVRRKRPIR